MVPVNVRENVRTVWMDMDGLMNSIDMVLSQFMYGCSSYCHSSSFSGIDFEGATVGLAFIGTLCSGHSVGVVQVRCSCYLVVIVLYVVLLSGCNVGKPRN